MAMSDEEVDILLERFDQTNPKIQRGIVAKAFEQLATVQDRLKEADGLLRRVVDGGYISGYALYPEVRAYLLRSSPKEVCSSCRGRGGWEDADEGQWVVCLKCKKE